MGLSLLQVSPFLGQGAAVFFLQLQKFGILHLTLVDIFGEHAEVRPNQQDQRQII